MGFPVFRCRIAIELKDDAGNVRKIDIPDVCIEDVDYSGEDEDPEVLCWRVESMIDVKIMSVEWDCGDNHVKQKSNKEVLS